MNKRDENAKAIERWGGIPEKNISVYWHSSYADLF